MWLELGDNVLIDLDCFSHFSIYVYTDDNVIYGMTERGNSVIYRSTDMDDVHVQFDLIREALRWRQGGGQRSGYAND